MFAVSAFLRLRSVIKKYVTHKMICKTVEHGVASPTLKSEIGTIRLIRNDTGILTPKAPAMPCIILNFVCPQPLK